MARIAHVAHAPKLAPKQPLRVEPVANPILRVLIVSALGTVIFVTMAAQKWSIGVPVRSILSVGLLGMLIVLYPGRAIRSFQRIRTFMIVVGLFAALGASLSLIWGDETSDILRSLIEIHVQTAITLYLTALVAECCGARAVIIAFIAVIVFSTIVAIGQFFGFSAAYEIRQRFNPLQDLTVDAFEGGTRAAGLSLSKTILASQACVALGAYLVHKMVVPGQSQLRLQPRHVIIGLTMLVFGALVSGNRSPILGAACLFAAYVARHNKRALVVLLPAAIAGVIFLDTIVSALESSGLRATQVGDDSALARVTLTHYGLLLFWANPIGYGLNFDPTLLWRPFAGNLQGETGANLITYMPLHNYIITMMNIYGVGLLVFLPYFVRFFARWKELIFPFTAYAVHILFHNSGPFYSELYLWFVVGAFPMLLAGAPNEVRVRRRMIGWGPTAGSLGTLGRGDSRGFVRPTAAQPVSRVSG